MKELLKELQFVLNSIPRTPYHFNGEETDTYKLVVKLGDIANDEPVKQESTPFQKYENMRGNRCPLCHGSHITAHPFNADDLTAWRDVECLECEETWREMFTMTNIEIL